MSIPSAHLPRLRCLSLSVTLLLFLSSCGMLNSCSHLGAPEPEVVQSKLREAVPRWAKGEEVVPGAKLAQAQRVAKFYRQRDYQPAWLEKQKWSGQVEALLTKIGQAGREGLEPAFYNSAALQKLHQPDTSPEQAARFDALLTDAFFAYASDLAIGHVNPSAVDDQWILRRKLPDLGNLMTQGIGDGKIASELDELAPPEKEYGQLKDLLESYRKVEAKGGWPTIPPGPLLYEGAHGPRVAALRQRLAATGELKDAGGDTYDRSVKSAVSLFQREHELPVDGIVTPPTIAALNVPVGERISQIAVNLERWRWLPHHIGENDKHIVVDIAKYEVSAYEGKKQVLAMKAIIGKDEAQTPILIDEMTQVVLNPAWNVPRSIVEDELLPKIQRNPAYLKQHDMKLYHTVSGKREEVSASSVDWKNVDPDHFPYTVTQAPGPKNPLGSIKFVFPNPLAIYLHGTVAPGLFKLQKRAFSHGCIRIEKPAQLALFVLNQGDEKITRHDLMEKIRSGDKQTLRLPAPMPVEVLYWTVALDKHGRAHFRNDVYGWDRPVYYALFRGLTPNRIPAHAAE